MAPCYLIWVAWGLLAIDNFNYMRMYVHFIFPICIYDSICFFVKEQILDYKWSQQQFGYLMNLLVPSNTWKIIVVCWSSITVRNLILYNFVFVFFNYCQDLDLRIFFSWIMNVGQRWAMILRISMATLHVATIFFFTFKVLQ